MKSETADEEVVLLNGLQRIRDGESRTDVSSSKWASEGEVNVPYGTSSQDAGPALKGQGCVRIL